MPRDVRPLAQIVTHDIWGVEFGQDRQIAKTAQFIATMAEARVASRTPAHVAHDALMCAGEAMQAALISRSKLVELHAKLQGVAGQVGIPELATGGEQKPDPGTYAPPRPSELPEEMTARETLSQAA